MSNAMKQKAIRRVAAVLTLFLLWAGVEYCARYFTNPLRQAWPMIREDRGAIEGSIDTAFIGASLFRNGIIPAAFDETTGSRSFNCATSGQTIGLTQYMLEDLSETNPLKLALIDVSVNRLLKDDSEGGLIAKHVLLSHLFNWSARADLLKDCFTLDDLPLTVLNSARDQLHFLWGTLSARLSSAYLKAYLRYGYVPDAEYPAGSMGYTPSNEANAEGGISFTEASSAQADAVEPGNMESLERIIARCREKGISPVLVSMPTTDTFLLTFPWYEAMQSPVRALASREGVPYLDFNLSKFRSGLTDANFLDERHMNDTGARLFTPHLAEVVKKALAGEDISSDFYASYGEAVRAIRRVSSVSLEVKTSQGAVILRAFSLQGAEVTPTYRFFLKPEGAPDEEYRALQSSGENCALNGLAPGAYTVRVEAYSTRDSACDAFHEQNVQIR